MTCLSYLRFRYFDGGITDDEVDGFIDRGEYALHLYSQSNFLHHIRGACRDVDGVSQTLKTSTGDFMKERWNPSFRHIDSETSPSCLTLEHIQSMDPEDYKRLNAIAAHHRARNLTEHPKGLFYRVIDC